MSESKRPDRSKILMGEKSVVRVKMARATPADLDVAIRLVGVLEAVDNGRYPSSLIDGLHADDAPDRFDADDPEHARKLVDWIVRLMASRPGGLARVVHGMAVLCDPVNAMIDPGADDLEPHPDLIRKSDVREVMLAFRARCPADSYGEHAVNVVRTLMRDLGLEAADG